MRGRRHGKAEEPPTTEAAASADETAEGAEPGAAAPEADPVADAPEPGAEAGTASGGEDPLETLQAEMDDLKDRHLRLAAEFDNYRKRTRREQAELRTAAQAEILRQVLPTMDDLARVAATPTETTSVEALETGLELILRNLKKHLEDSGLEPIEAEGRRFDPEEQQAVLLAPTDDPSLDETVSRVFLQGYRFRDRLLRPAQVEVRRYEPDGGDTVAGGEDAADGEA